LAYSKLLGDVVIPFDGVIVASVSTLDKLNIPCSTDLLAMMASEIFNVDIEEQSIWRNRVETRVEC
jgi:hypothetical protein